MAARSRSRLAGLRLAGLRLAGLLLAGLCGGLGCTPREAPPPAPAPIPMAPPTPAPPPPVRLDVPAAGRSVVAPPGSRVERGTLPGADRIVLPGGATLVVRRRHGLDGELAAHAAAVGADRIRRFVREVRRAGSAGDFLYVHALDQLGERRVAVRRMWPAGLGHRLCVGDAPDRATADRMIDLCLGLAPLPGTVR